jgi:hypothetical protein
MNCTQARAHLDRFVDAEMDGPALAEINEHLSGCPDCREIFNRAGRLHVGVRRVLAQERMPEDVWMRLATALADADRRAGGGWMLPGLFDPMRLRRMVQAALGLALTAAGVLLAAHLLRPTPKPYPGLETRAEGAKLAEYHFNFGPRGREQDIPLQTHFAEFLTKDWRIRIPADGPHKVLSVFHEVLQFDRRRVLHIGYNCDGNPVSIYVIPDFVGSVEMVAELGREAGVKGRFFEHRRLGQAWLAAVADNNHDVGFLLRAFVKEEGPG